MRTDSIFRIASMTKPITSVAIMMLWEQGKLDLDDPVSKHIPEFENMEVLVDVDPLVRVSKDRACSAVRDGPISGCRFDSELGEKRGDFYLYCRQNGLWCQEVAGFDPIKEPEKFIRFCPVHNVTKEYPPTMLLRGDQDTDVPHEQSVMMANELERRGVGRSVPGQPSRSPPGTIHCDIGLSRSPAVAASLSRIYYGDDGQWFEMDFPNRLVYDVLLEAHSRRREDRSP